MPVVLLRVDDRYIHGQITAKWMQRVNGQAIWVVSDALGKNPVLKSLQESLAPPGSKVKISSVNEALKECASVDKGDERVVLLVASPEDALTVMKNGIGVDHVNVGQMGFKHGKKQVSKTVSVDANDVKAFKEIIKMGVRLEYQQLPDFPQKPVDFEATLKEMKLI